MGSEVLASAETVGRSLVSIAMLKVRYDQNQQDYLDYLRPFVQHVLPKKGERVQAGQVATDVADEFGLRVPAQVIERLLSRLQKQGQLARVDNALYVENVLRDPGLETRRSGAVDDITAVVGSFKTHCLARFDRALSDQDAAVALAGFVRKFAVDCLRSFAQPTALPPVRANDAADTWVASFINDAAQEEGPLWDQIRTLFKSVLLANAFTCPDPDLATAKFRELAFYFDTPLVLSAIGLHGEYERRKTLELVRQIKALEGSCFVFEHTVDETNAVLKFAESHLDDADLPNRVIRNLRDEGKQRSDVVLIMATLEQELRDVGIRVRSTPKYDERFQIDEAALEGCLDEDIGHLNEKALLHDINSVRSIYVLRSGSVPRRIEDARAVLVTSNFKFAKAVDQFSKRFEFSKEVSPVVTDFALANICWLKRPAQAEELVTLELLASTEAALSPSMSEWKACLDECEQLRKQGKITADQEILVRENLVAKQDYVTLTRGSGAAFNTTVALELVRRAEERVSAPLRAEAEGVQIKLRSAEELLGKQQQTAADTLAKQRTAIARVAHGLAFAIGVVIAALLSYGTWKGLESTITGTPVGRYGLIVRALAIAAPVAMFVLGYFGWSAIHIHQRLKHWLATRICALFHVEGASSG